MTKEETIANLAKFEKRLEGCHRLLHDEEEISDEEIASITAARMLLTPAE